MDDALPALLVLAPASFCDELSLRVPVPVPVPVTVLASLSFSLSPSGPFT